MGHERTEKFRKKNEQKLIRTVSFDDKEEDLNGESDESDEINFNYKKSNKKFEGSHSKKNSGKFISRMSNNKKKTSSSLNSPARKNLILKSNSPSNKYHQENMLNSKGNRSIKLNFPILENSRKMMRITRNPFILETKEIFQKYSLKKNNSYAIKSPKNDQMSTFQKPIKSLKISKIIYPTLSLSKPNKNINYYSVDGFNNQSNSLKMTETWSNFVDWMHIKENYLIKQENSKDKKKKFIKFKKHTYMKTYSQSDFEAQKKEIKGFQIHQIKKIRPASKI